MRTIVSAKEMRWCDEVTIRKHGIPGLQLMEKAGRGVAETAISDFGVSDGKRVAIICGKGNNGGDGFVAARYLVQAGVHTTLLLLTPSRSIQGDAKTNLDVLEQFRNSTNGSLTIKRFSSAVIKKLPQQDLIIDAIFGTGFSGAVREPAFGAIRWINSQTAPVLAVDIPSGVDGTTGIVENAAAKAKATVTFGLLKTGLLCNQGQDLAGEIHTVDIGIPRSVSQAKTLKTFLVELEDVKRFLPKRSSTANKYSVGKVFILAGAKGYTGAAYLCAMAALRAGAGAVVLGIPETVYAIIAKRLADAIVQPLPSTKEGTVSLKSMAEIEERLAWADVTLLGPGLSTNAETQGVITTILNRHAGKMLVDADALRGIAAIGLAQLSRRKGQFILTPHSGEYSRILGIPSGEIDVDRIAAARMGSSKGRVTIVAKGGPTAIGTQDGNVFLNSTGNPGMATVGSGDVLAGIIAALWAQGAPQNEAAVAGVFLHGLAGDFAGDILGQRSIIAQDLIEYLPPAVKSVEGT